MTEPRISGVEAFLLVIFALIVDIVDLIPIADIIASVCSVIIFQFYFFMKGVRGTYGLAGNLIDLIPVIGYLPATTAGVIATIIIDRSDSLKKAASPLKVLPGKGEQSQTSTRKAA